MEIKNDKKIVVTGKTICMIAGILAAICGVYWLVKALFYDETNLPAILSSIALSLFLTLYSHKK